MRPQHDIQLLRTIDLNLVVALAALLRTQGVTRAADQLDVSQPAMSRMLERLRAQFGDPLLVRVGNDMALTPRARALLPTLDTLLARMSGLLFDAGIFDPAHSNRHFVIGCNDYLQLTFAAPLLRRLRSIAPHVRLDLRPVTVIGDDTELADGTVDLKLGTANPARDLVRTHYLYSDMFVCLMRRRGDGRTAPIGLETFCATPQLSVSPSGQGLLSQMVDAQIAHLGGRRNVVATVSSFLSAPAVIADTDLICAMPGRMAHLLNLPPGLEIVTMGFEPPRLDVLMYWHNVAQHDPGSRWLREQVVACAHTFSLPNA
ncbi:LysR family transcriptional regulator [Verticiella sediminum]|uniref:LysR family transcriptional regulator n=1 Tax=Verticiella sediminum TaxID=1247510 RepID=A0A556B0C2_9BURK|nr:LysR family transcriptional regulator [Verticiella sediminum]TSH98619.1 LysR family transcriptional regulator [Verticiella sediminum]